MIINKVVLRPEIMVKYQKILSNPLTHKSLLKSYSVKLCAYFVPLCVTKRYSIIPTFLHPNTPLLYYSNLYGLYDAKV